MTRVLNERYGFAWRGTAAFLTNRVPRLWPSYSVIIGLVLLALQFLPLSNLTSSSLSEPLAALQTSSPTLQLLAKSDLILSSGYR
jgi:peptidoglycan/LPS O-acetylase OafA/YrhL